MALTVCVEGSPGECEHEHYCTVRGPLAEDQPRDFQRPPGGHPGRPDGSGGVGAAPPGPARQRPAAGPTATPAGSREPERTREGDDDHDRYPDHRTARDPRVQVRFHHRHRAGHLRARAFRRDGAPDLGAQGGARVAARVAPQGVPPLAHDEGADLGERALSADRLSVDRLLRGAEVDEERAEVARRRRPGAPQDLREARHPAPRARRARRRRGRRGLRFGLGRDDLQGRSSTRWESSSAASRRRCASIRSW